MRAYQCKMCGAGLNPRSDGVCTCEYCGTKYYLSLDEKLTAGGFDNETQMPVAQITFSIKAEQVFFIKTRGVVITGEVAQGEVSVGDGVKVIKSNGQRIESAVVGIEQFRKFLDKAKKGDKIGLMLAGVTKEQISAGDIVIKGELDLNAVVDYIKGRYLPTNEKVMAIDFYRKATGVGLKEAKDRVDEIFAGKR